MRLDDNLVARLKVRVNVRFVVEDIQTSACDLSGLEGVDQALLVDHWTASGVDEEHAVFHRGELGRTDEAGRGGVQWTADGDDIRHGQ